MRLMDGFYGNIEDGLFEMAYAHTDPEKQRQAVDLMRELRFRREQFLTTFAKRMQSVSTQWYQDTDANVTEYLEMRMMAENMATRSAGHFSGLLQRIAERVAHATDRDIDRGSLPLCPEEVSYHFIMSCRSLNFGEDAIEMVQDLFHRFVLDRLGSVYGPINQQLADAGFCTFHELQEAAAAHSA